MIIDYFKELILNNFGHNPTTQQQEVVEALAEFILRVTDSGTSADKQKLSADSSANEAAQAASSEEYPLRQGSPLPTEELSRAQQDGTHRK